MEAGAETNASGVWNPDLGERRMSISELDAVSREG